MYMQLSSKAFVMSSKTYNLSMSVTSSVFVHSSLGSNIPQEKLICLIQSKQLWLLPRGLCRLDVALRLSEYEICSEEQDALVDLVVDTICQCPLWSQLGLKAKILDVQYRGEEGNHPNLYFGIEQPDMSSALISPPHAHTAHLSGLECILQFASSNHMEKSPGSKLSSDRAACSDGLITNHQPDSLELWEHSSDLVEAAFCIIIGTRKIFQGLSIREPQKSPSLLDLAPAICNSRYRKSIVSHTKYFATLANIFASSLNGQSPELRRKGAELLGGGSAELNRGSSQHSVTQLESSVHRLLWDSLQNDVKPTIGTRRTKAKKVTLPAAESNHPDKEINQIYTHHFESDLSAMQDQPMSDYMYEESNDFHSYEYGYVVPAGLGSISSELTGIPLSY
ncbi:hypothetical protein F5B22DRAFT_60744 [Xylaria bambusicola]|uniref:uncharacterized protein n=1 Tax=Xylaria bambusicola TaxID=326684 RepID=UPI00200892FE|nr:uncharacterized protein F5B22DRAFT_60744 [Xylaria bambusicola]KAI0518406.1 hypothetical protein F5B22DRAFT_60744 [Xylaria bambusicola]